MESVAPSATQPQLHAVSAQQPCEEIQRKKEEALPVCGKWKADVVVWGKSNLPQGSLCQDRTLTTGRLEGEQSDNQR